MYKTRKLLKVMETVCIWIAEVVSEVYIPVKTHQIVNFKGMIFHVRKFQ